MKKRSPIKQGRAMKLQTSITLLIIFIVSLSVIIMNGFFSKYITENTKDTISQRLYTISRLVAQSDLVIEGLQNEKQRANIQEYANELKALSNIGFLVVLDMNLIRLSHPIPSEVGKSFYNREDAKPSLGGLEYTSIEKGPLGLGMRVFTPIKNEQNKQIGVVVAGLSMDKVEDQIEEGQRMILLGAIFQLLLGVIGAYFISKYVKKILFGMEPVEIAQLTKERDTMLESVKEGILVVNQSGEITRVNQQALKLMALTEELELIGRPVRNYMPTLQQTIQTGIASENGEARFYGKKILLNCSPIYIDDKIVGGIATFRDKTEVQKLLDEMVGIKNYTEALRAQSHEFKNKLHVILGMLHLKEYKELETMIPSMVDQFEEEVGYIMQRLKHPALAGFLIGKMSKARESNITFELEESSFLKEEFTAPIVHELITILGSLIENGFEAVLAANSKHKTVKLFIHSKDQTIHIKIEDNGPGIAKDHLDNLFDKQFSTKGGDRGYGLFLTYQTVQKLQGKINVSTRAGNGTVFNITLAMPMVGDDNDQRTNRRR